MKPHTYKEKETLRERGTKRYQERLVEEKEAEQEIKQYQEEEQADNDEHTPTIQEFLW